jgi:hypothetical protein
VSSQLQEQMAILRAQVQQQRASVEASLPAPALSPGHDRHQPLSARAARGSSSGGRGRLFQSHRSQSMPAAEPHAGAGGAGAQWRPASPCSPRSLQQQLLWAMPELQRGASAQLQSENLRLEQQIENLQGSLPQQPASDGARAAPQLPWSSSAAAAGPAFSSLPSFQGGLRAAGALPQPSQGSSRLLSIRTTALPSTEEGASSSKPAMRSILALAAAPERQASGSAASQAAAPQQFKVYTPKKRLDFAEEEQDGQHQQQEQQQWLASGAAPGVHPAQLVLNQKTHELSDTKASLQDTLEQLQEARREVHELQSDKQELESSLGVALQQGQNRHEHGKAAQLVALEQQKGREEAAALQQQLDQQQAGAQHLRAQLLASRQQHGRELSLLRGQVQEGSQQQERLQQELQEAQASLSQLQPFQQEVEVALKRMYSRLHSGDAHVTQPPPSRRLLVVVAGEVEALVEARQRLQQGQEQLEEQQALGRRQQEALGQQQQETLQAELQLARRQLQEQQQEMLRTIKAQEEEVQRAKALAVGLQQQLQDKHAKHSTAKEVMRRVSETTDQLHQDNVDLRQQ